MFDLLSPLALLPIFLLVGIVILVIAASTTSIGQALLPDRVVDVVTRLVPYAKILDVTVTAYGEFQLQVEGATKLKTVNVRRSDRMTFAWTFDPTQDCPQSGTYCFTDFGHSLDTTSDSALAPEKVKARVQVALENILPAKQFALADSGVADVLIRVFAAIEDDVSVEGLTDGFQSQQNDEWQSAIRTVLEHSGSKNSAAIVSGSLLIYLFDSRSHQLLWRAAALGKFAVDASDGERERRIQSAISEMLRHFPPAKPKPTVCI